MADLPNLSSMAEGDPSILILEKKEGERDVKFFRGNEYSVEDEADGPLLKIGGGLQLIKPGVIDGRIKISGVSGQKPS